ncbi:neuroligin-1-like [Trichogramma pretiosum]|uniref:neuroligin-1-like n=1 Tax=Trichogramma pretiosum TaxID=7493 RepID=UPI0006C9855C|nr:neuroligin-1-like [Trichogramma pretiosum]
MRPGGPEAARAPAPGAASSTTRPKPPSQHRSIPSTCSFKHLARFPPPRRRRRLFYSSSSTTRPNDFPIIVTTIVPKKQHQSNRSSQPKEEQQQHRRRQQRASKYSTRQVHTRYGQLRGTVSRAADSRSSQVEVYLGVPYATPPLGALRFMPPVTPSPWRGIRLADAYPPACPQLPPRPGPDTPRQYARYLERLGPMLANQSEDCLYLNLYVPVRPAQPAQQQHQQQQASAGSSHHGSGAAGQDLLPALLLIHGDSYSWGSGNPLDGTALAAHGRLIVVSINFRLGLLGFLKTSTKSSAQGNYGLMDLVAGVHWLRENLPAFGGDSNRLTLMGHGTGAALANFLAVSPMAKELVDRVVLLGGSALSPWAVQREPLQVKRRVAEQLDCGAADPEAEDIAACLRAKSTEELLGVKLDVPRFTSGFAPFVDGAILPASLPTNPNFHPTVSSSGLMPLMPGSGSELANFGGRDVLMGLTSDEAWLELTEQDLENGLNETRRDRILRTYVRNTYRYHLHEIYSTLRNEYTDWERGEPNPLAICEGLLALLGDGQVAAPLLRLALLHSASGGRGYFLHFQPGDRPSLRGEELPFFMGLPLVRADANYSLADEALSRLLVHYLANFVRRGDPNGAATASSSSVTSSGSSGSSWASSADLGVSSPPFWDSYDSINQLYLEAGRDTGMRSHYRGHKMSLWLNLLPQLHRPGYEVSMRHHHMAESPSLYEGAVRPQSMAMPIPAPPLPMPYPTEPSLSNVPGGSGNAGGGGGPIGVTASTQASGTDCTPNASSSSSTVVTSTTTPSNMPHLNLGPGPNNLLRKLASSHYQSYITALTVTIAVGVFLLLLNILIFAGIYHKRDKNRSAAAQATHACSMGNLSDKKKEDLLEIGCSDGVMSVGSMSSKLGMAAGSQASKRSLSTFVMTDSQSDSSSPVSSTTHHHHLQHLQQQQQQHHLKGSGSKFLDELDHHMQLQDYERAYYVRAGPASSSPPSRHRHNRTPSPCVDATMAAVGCELDDDLPEPPPPPKSPAPREGMLCPGILRQPGTPGSAKKRVQIQEISV